jgi:orotate phosphoribosyltransferase
MAESGKRGTTVYDKDALVAIIRQKALRFGQFTLASGKRATYYLDGKQATLDPEGSRLVAEGILDLLAGGLGALPGSVRRKGAQPSAVDLILDPGPAEFPAAIGGMSIGADPITAAVVVMSAVRGTPLRGFMVRKEPKGHGTNQYVEGPVTPGEHVVIVEDVVTTGGSSLAAIQRCEDFGLRVAGVLAVVDRMEGGAEAFASRGYPLASLLTIRDFGIEPPA